MWPLEGASGGRGDDGSFKDRMRAGGNERLPVTTVLVAGVVKVEEFQGKHRIWGATSHWAMAVEGWRG